MILFIDMDAVWNRLQNRMDDQRGMELNCDMPEFLLQWNNECHGDLKFMINDKSNDECDKILIFLINDDYNICNQSVTYFMHIYLYINHVAITFVCRRLLLIYCLLENVSVFIYLFSCQQL